jgi:Tuberin
MNLIIDLPRDSPAPIRSRPPWSPSDTPKSVPTNGVHVTDLYTAKNRLKSFDDHVSDDEDDDEKDGEEKHIQHLARARNLLPVSVWLDVLINLCRNEKSWELYYHLVEHFADQLANKTFFVACNPQIIRLREIICSQLINSHLPDLDEFNNQKRIEVIMRLHKILTVLIGYHIIFVKASRDELVRCFQINMGRYNPLLTKQCIHSLMVCCHELPKSIARCLSGILQTLSHQITNPVLSVHILEFLVGVGRIPKIHGSFTTEEFAMVFQVALKFLQHSRATARERTNMTDSAMRMSQYIIYLAFEALTVWFLAVKLENRRAHVAWIIRQLILANETSGLDDQGQVFVDMLERFSYSDSPLKKYADTVDVEGLAQYKKHWIVGTSVQTAQVVREDGLVKMTVRKPV